MECIVHSKWIAFSIIKLYESRIPTKIVFYKAIFERTFDYLCVFLLNRTPVCLYVLFINIKAGMHHEITQNMTVFNILALKMNWATIVHG